MRYKELIEYKKFSHDGKDYDYTTTADPDHVEFLKNRQDTDIGPHEGKELQMMLDGVKPAALVALDDYNRSFKKYTDEGKFITCPHPKSKWHILVGLPGEERRLEKISDVLSSDMGDVPKYHIMLGRLLGYTKDQIRKFI